MIEAEDCEEEKEEDIDIIENNIKIKVLEQQQQQLNNNREQSSNKHYFKECNKCNKSSSCVSKFSIYSNLTYLCTNCSNLLIEAINKYSKDKKLKLEKENTIYLHKNSINLYEELKIQLEINNECENIILENINNRIENHKIEIRKFFKNKTIKDLY